MDEADEEDQAEAYHLRSLDKLREIADDGMHLAVPAALFYCATNNVPVPEWLATRASKLMNGLLHLHDDLARKRMRKMIRTYRENQIHYARYVAVRAAKEARVGLLEDQVKMKGRKGKRERWIIEDLKLMLGRLGTSDEDIYGEASSRLKGTNAAGEADAVKKSHQRLAREVGRGNSMLKYSYFDDNFLQRIGAHQKF
jgi:hypothetical protein